jgi:trk system potassium uptake protein TrkH
VPDRQVFRALSIAVFALSVTFAGTVWLAFLVPYTLPVVWLLVVQAFSLAGAESELLAALGTPGQLVLAFLIVLGRFGPLGLALIFATQVPRETVHYARETVRLG